MPAVGIRWNPSGGLARVGDWGPYWSSTQASTSAGYRLLSSSSGSSPSSGDAGKTDGNPIRCVRKSITFFLPAVGYRFDDVVFDPDARGNYWSATQQSGSAGFYLAFSIDISGLFASHGKSGASTIRCVR